MAAESFSYCNFYTFQNIEHYLKRNSHMSLNLLQLLVLFLISLRFSYCLYFLLLDVSLFLHSQVSFLLPFIYSLAPFSSCFALLVSFAQLFSCLNFFSCFSCLAVLNIIFYVMVGLDLDLAPVGGLVPNHPRP